MEREEEEEVREVDEVEREKGEGGGRSGSQCDCKTGGSGGKPWQDRYQQREQEYWRE